MSASQVDDVYIVPHAGTISSRVVIAVDFHVLTFSRLQPAAQSESSVSRGHDARRHRAVAPAALK